MPPTGPNTEAKEATRVAELIRAVRHDAWNEGYRACYEGKQRHNPYRKKEND